PRTGKKANAHDPKAWSSLPAAKAAYQASGYDGVGFKILPKDDMTVCDLDHCRHPDTNELTDWAREVVKALRSNTTISPREDGLRIIVKGRKPPDCTGSVKPGLPSWDGGQGGRLEIYDGGPGTPYMTYTGHLFNGEPGKGFQKVLCRPEAIA